MHYCKTTSRGPQLHSLLGPICGKCVPNWLLTLQSACFGFLIQAWGFELSMGNGWNWKSDWYVGQYVMSWKLTGAKDQGSNRVRHRLKLVIFQKKKIAGEGERTLSRKQGSWIRAGLICGHCSFCLWEGRLSLNNCSAGRKPNQTPKEIHWGFSLKNPDNLKSTIL